MYLSLSFSSKKLKLVNTWQSYRQKGWLPCVPCSPCNVLLKDKKNWPDNSPMTDGSRICSCYVTMQIIFEFTINIYHTNRYFKNFFEQPSLTPPFAALSHWAWQFFEHEDSQGSVATRLRCGGLFNNDFISNLPVSPLVKKFCKSVSIWQSYGQQSSVLFFDSQCTTACTTVGVSNFADTPIGLFYSLLALNSL